MLRHQALSATPHRRASAQRPRRAPTLDIRVNGHYRSSARLDHGLLAPVRAGTRLSLDHEDARAQAGAAGARRAVLGAAWTLQQLREVVGSERFGASVSTE